MDLHKVIPLLFRETAEEGMRERIRRHLLKCRDFGTELVDGGGLVMSGPGEPPLGDFDARLHSSLAQDSVHLHRAQEPADDPGCPISQHIGAREALQEFDHREALIRGQPITKGMALIPVTEPVGVVDLRRDQSQPE